MHVSMTPPYSNPFPPAGQLLSTYCSGTTKMGRYTDGSGGTYDQAIQVNSPDCGYVAPPAAGTLLSTYCSGTTKMGSYADGNGGSYGAIIQTNSPECGFLEGGTGELRVNCQWNGACDVDFHITAPDGFQYGYSYPGGGNGVWDHDSTNAGQENVAWNPSAPNGQYVVQLVNFNGTDPGTVTLTVIAKGVTQTIDMTGLLPLSARAVSTKNVVFSISNGAFSSNPVLV